ncbi:hypothetical protein Q5P01_005415 [Channa striata]|uniref:A to I editase domain-containing protein n=1 Tax=Channa striata TaxID=64152 RepID=A0AA88NNT0_CHASR|nr:hypothetical protein Q5P01_005415 [Channa striata]
MKMMITPANSPVSDTPVAVKCYVSDGNSGGRRGNNIDETLECDCLHFKTKPRCRGADGRRHRQSFHQEECNISSCEDGRAPPNGTVHRPLSSMESRPCVRLTRRLDVSQTEQRCKIRRKACQDKEREDEGKEETMAQKDQLHQTDKGATGGQGRRQATPLVGDLRPLVDALPELCPLMSLSTAVCHKSTKNKMWNVFGFQRSLMSYFTEPLYFSSIILGSLYHADHLSRAMYQRLTEIKDLPQSFSLNRPLLSGESNTPHGITLTY